MDVKLIKFGTKEALAEFVERAKIDYNKLSNTWPNGVNSKDLDRLPKMKEDLEYLQTKLINWKNWGK